MESTIIESTTDRSYQRLVANLEEMTKLYRQLLDLVRKEKQLLVDANMEKLQENNEIKENLLFKIKSVDGLRMRYAAELATLVEADHENPRLLDIAKNLGGVEGDRLRVIHSALDLLVKRLSFLNRENEDVAQTALKTLNGALGNIKDTLSGKKTYGAKGQVQRGPELAGHFVSKEG
ncbi:MAG TPA: flagellar protein FlgN [Pseudobdellovibrionaceae bacterium]|jgi:flagellar biosynthesis/type III secretory pathway chaperone